MTDLPFGNPFSDLPREISIAMSPAVLWAIIGVALIIYAIVTAILIYHWDEYALENERVTAIAHWYFFVTGVCILAAVAGAIAFTMSV